MNPDRRQYHDVKEVRREGGRGRGIKVGKGGKILYGQSSLKSSLFAVLSVCGKKF